MLRNMMGWGGWGMMLTFLELAYMVDAMLQFWRAKCQNESSFRVQKMLIFVVKHNGMAIMKPENQWKFVEKRRVGTRIVKTHGNTSPKRSKIYAMYWKCHGRLHTVYLVVHLLTPWGDSPAISWCVLKLHTYTLIQSSENSRPTHFVVETPGGIECIIWWYKLPQKWIYKNVTAASDVLAS